MFLYIYPCFGNFWGTLTSERLLDPCEKRFFLEILHANVFYSGKIP
jgi:hypothetical protein